ncbi:3b84408c-68dd-4ee2-afda-3dc49b9f3a1a [Thermothielavioides terrestris]|uniref:3b84408c-68dd-4ee2-afda-3dc49b9f3a1a n=1 Tax=Thermothielavioides terrestris TaxID=2587410 RepID=A0A446BAB9_9PEZI|nr:3b84408c-68dd-4ee2-afda-3dc49b9f3a1a [Thermothielavioides terrestris]
MPKANGYTNRP